MRVFPFCVLLLAASGCGHASFAMDIIAMPPLERIAGLPPISEFFDGEVVVEKSEEDGIVSVRLTNHATGMRLDADCGIRVHVGILSEDGEELYVYLPDVFGRISQKSIYDFSIDQKLKAVFTMTVPSNCNGLERGIYRFQL